MNSIDLTPFYRSININDEGNTLEHETATKPAVEGKKTSENKAA